VTLLHNITLELSHRKICTKFFFLFLLTPQTDAGQTRKLRRERERERERERDVEEEEEEEEEAKKERRKKPKREESLGREGKERQKIRGEK
jgi:hypothetical protein